MKNFLFKSFFPVLFLLVAVSCSQVIGPEEDINGDNLEEVVMPVHLDCAPLEGGSEIGSEEEIAEEGADTKSDYYDGTVYSKITDMNYYLFQNGTLVSQQYFSSVSDFAVKIPDRTKSYNLYIVANIGQKTLSSGSKESSLNNYQIAYTTDNYISTMRNKGFPMYASVSGFDVNHDGNFTLTRLIHQVILDFDFSEYDSLDMRPLMRGTWLSNMPLEVYPFRPSSNPTNYANALDVFQEDQGSSLTNGSTVTLYVLENMPSASLPSGTTWKEKYDYAISNNIKGTGVVADYDVLGDWFITNQSSQRQCYLGEKGSGSSATGAENFYVRRNRYTRVHVHVHPESNSGEDDDIQLTGDVSIRPTFQRTYQGGDIILVPGFNFDVEVATNIPFSYLNVSTNTSDFIVDDSRFAQGILTLIPKHQITCAMFPGYQGPVYHTGKLIFTSDKDSNFRKEFDIKLQDSAFSVDWKTKNINDKYYLTLADYDAPNSSNSNFQKFLDDYGLTIKLSAYDTSLNYIEGITRFRRPDLGASYQAVSYRENLTPSEGIDSSLPNYLWLSSNNFDCGEYGTYSEAIQSNKGLYRKGIVQRGAARLADAGHQVSDYQSSTIIDTWPQDLFVRLNVKISLIKGSTTYTLYDYAYYDERNESCPLPICFTKYHKRFHDRVNWETYTMANLRSALTNNAQSYGNSDGRTFNPNRIYRMNNGSASYLQKGYLDSWNLEFLRDENLLFNFSYYNDGNPTSQLWNLATTSRYFRITTDTGQELEPDDWKDDFYFKIIKGNGRGVFVQDFTHVYDETQGKFRESNFLMEISINDGYWDYLFPGLF